MCGGPRCGCRYTGSEAVAGSDIRSAPQEGQNPRRLPLNASSSSWPNSAEVPAAVWATSHLDASPLTSALRRGDCDRCLCVPRGVAAQCHGLGSGGMGQLVDQAPEGEGIGRRIHSAPPLDQQRQVQSQIDQAQVRHTAPVGLGQAILGQHLRCHVVGALGHGAVHSEHDPTVFREAQSCVQRLTGGSSLRRAQHAADAGLGPPRRGLGGRAPAERQRGGPAARPAAWLHRRSRHACGAY